MKVTKYLPCILILTFQPLSAQNFWHQTNGPYGVPTVYDFLQYNDSTIFLGTNEGIIRSKDNGETWSRIDGLYLNAQIRGITKDYFGTLYAGRYDTEYGLKMLFKSTDGGNTWNQMSWGDAEIRYIFIPYKDTIMVGSWDKGVYRSFDGGLTWSRVNNGNIYNGIYEIIQPDDGSILAGSAGGGVFKTTNWGDLWIPSNTGLPVNSQGYRFAKSFCKTSPNCLLVGTQAAVYYSTNNGETWSFKSAGLTNKEINKIKKDENGIFYAGVDLGNGVYYSTNGGDYWYHLGLNITTYNLGWDSEPRLYAGGLSAGLYRFVVEDSTWSRVIDQGYNPVKVNYLWITDSGNLIAGTDYWGLKYTSNSGTNWNTINAPAGFYAFETINDSIFVGGGSEHVYVSNDTGKIWTERGNFWTSSMYYESINQYVYVGTKRNYPSICAIYKSNDFGQSWQLIYNFPSFGETQWANPILITKTNNIFLVYVVHSSQNGQFFRFYKSTDFGQTWEILTEDNDYYPLQIIEDDSLNIFTLTGTNGSRLSVSEDEGETWILKNIPQTQCIVSGHNGKLYRVYSNQIYYSEDKGSTWIEVNNTGLSGIGIYDVVINQNNRIYLATNKGVYYGEADSLVVSVEQHKPVNSFYLSQNYPNPFNPSTKIKYTIPTSPSSSPLVKRRNEVGFVSLKVYDVLGNEIVTLVNEEKHPGTYEVIFDGKQLPSGIYFYQLRVGDPVQKDSFGETSSGQAYLETKKMVLIK